MDATSLRLVWFDFDGLPQRLLYGVMALRQRVFVVEQRCAYLDIDGRDPRARHLVALGDNPFDPAACLRLFGPDDDGAARLGRIVVAPEFRGTGIGPVLIREGLAESARAFPGAPVVISAQAALAGYYASFGFTAEGAVYDEDGIPHVKMRASGEGQEPVVKPPSAPADAA